MKNTNLLNELKLRKKEREKERNQFVIVYKSLA